MPMFALGSAQLPVSIGYHVMIKIPGDDTFPHREIINAGEGHGYDYRQLDCPGWPWRRGKRATGALVDAGQKTKRQKTAGRNITKIIQGSRWDRPMRADKKDGEGCYEQG